MTNHTRCLTCSTPLHHELRWSQLFNFKRLEFDCVCQKCRSQFQLFGRQDESCLACGKQLISQSAIKQTITEQQTVYCLDCQKWLKQYPINYFEHEAIFEYNAMLREWLYRYKYQADQRQSEVVKQSLNELYRRRSTYQWLVLPSSPVSLKERGFHATGHLLDEAGIPYTMPLGYTGDGRKQAKKDRRQRLLMQQPFQLLDQEDFLSRPPRWLIFDDVYTTGTTILKAKEVLFKKWTSAGRPIDDLKVVSVSLARESISEKMGELLEDDESN